MRSMGRSSLSTKVEALLPCGASPYGIAAPGGPLGASQDQHGGQEAPQDNRHAVLERSIFKLQLSSQPAPGKEVDIFQDLEQNSHADGRGQDPARIHFAVRQQQINEENRAN